MSNINDFVIKNGVLEKYKGKDAEVVIPDSVTSIGKYAFHLCYMVESVTIPASVTKIGERAFYQCSRLSSVTIGNSVKSIGEMAFYRCSRLSSVTLGNSVTSICKSAFSGCESLTSITVPNSVKRLGDFSFYGCSSLASVTITASVTSIGCNAFSECIALESIKVDEKNAHYKSVDGHLYDKNVETLIQYAAGKIDTTFCVPASVTSIGESAFRGCKSLTSIFIPNSVKCIEQYAFWGCTSLASVAIGNSLEIVSEGAFGACCSLKKVLVWASDLDDDVLTVISDISALSILIAPKMSFDVLKKHGLALPAANGYLLNREMFESHHEQGDYKKYISAQKKRILPEIFKEDLVECLSVYAENGTITKNNFEEDFFNLAQAANATKCVAFLLNWKSNNLSQRDMDINLERELTKDPFNVKDMQKIWSFEKLENGTLAITGYKGDETIVSIPERIGKNAVAAIEKYAFSAVKSGRHWATCEKLRKIREIIIPGSVTIIGEHAFSGCTSLTNAIIPGSVTIIGEGAFHGCTSLTNAIIPGSVTIIGESAFYECTSLTNAIIPGSVTIIGESAFYRCTSLASIEVDEGNRYYKSIDGILYGKDLKSIIQYAAGKKGTDFVVPDSVTSIGEGAFSYCGSLASITIPDSVTSIGAWAFSNCVSLTSITIPDSVTSIGKGAFCDCDSLTSVTIPDSVMSIDAWTFAGCDSLTSVTIPVSVTSIGDYAFDGCTNLTSITIPDSVKSIGAWAFSYCGSLTSITIPDSVKSICEGTFCECASLEKVSIPVSVTSIERMAFASCPITDVYYSGSEKKWENIPYCEGNDTLYWAEAMHFGK